MRRPFSCYALALVLGFSMMPTDAEAKRLGGARSLGMQRQAAPPKAPEAAPKPAPDVTPAAAPAAKPKSSWMGPLAGLAAGLGLAALAAHFGLGEALASLLLIGLLVVGGLVLFRLLTRRTLGVPQAAMAGAGGVSPARSTPDAGGAMPGSVIDSFARSDVPRPAIPADFDAAGFARNAKVNFIRLQAANDAGDLDDLRAFTTPEMFAELSMDIRDRRGDAQHTEVIAIDAQVIEAVEEDSRYVVSVRFSGQLREAAEAPAAPIDEVWHLVKPRGGQSGWLLAGIQQMQ